MISRGRKLECSLRGARDRGVRATVARTREPTGPLKKSAMRRFNGSAQTEPRLQPGHRRGAHRKHRDVRGRSVRPHAAGWRPPVGGVRQHAEADDDHRPAPQDPHAGGRGERPPPRDRPGQGARRSPPTSPPARAPSAELFAKYEQYLLPEDADKWAALRGDFAAWMELDSRVLALSAAHRTAEATMLSRTHSKQWESLIKALIGNAENHLQSTTPRDLRRVAYRAAHPGHRVRAVEPARRDRRGVHLSRDPPHGRRGGVAQGPAARRQRRPRAHRRRANPDDPRDPRSRPLRILPGRPRAADHRWLHPLVVQPARQGRARRPACQRVPRFHRRSRR